MSSALKRTKANLHSQTAEVMRDNYMDKVQFLKCPKPKMNMMKFKSKG